MRKLILDDIDDLIGIPWKRGAFGPDFFDCWGIVHKCMTLIGHEHLVEVDYTFRHGIEGEFSAGVRDGHVTDASETDDNVIVICYRGDRAEHIGIMIDGYLLHSIGRPGAKGSVQLTRLAAIRRMFTRLEFKTWQNY